MWPRNLSDNVVALQRFVSTLLTPIFLPFSFECIIIQFRLTMAKENVKVVENYLLEQLKYQNLDQSELWMAKHKILKKYFTIKRMKNYRQLTETRQRKQQQAVEQQIHQILMRETNILKRLCTNGTPKCHKMIKTINSHYLVYDQFPGTPLQDILQKNIASRQQKLQLILTIAKQTSYYHSLGLVFINLSCNNIHVCKKSLFFRDLSIARIVEGGKELKEMIYLSNKTLLSGIVAKQVIEDGVISLASDIYSLGKIYGNIMKSGHLQVPTVKDIKLKQLVSQMTKQIYSQRPTISQIIRTLQRFCTISSNPQASLVRQIPSPLLKSNKSANELISNNIYHQQPNYSDYTKKTNFPNNFQKAKSTNNQETKQHSNQSDNGKSCKTTKTAKTDLPHINLNVTRTKKLNIKEEIENSVKLANKRRNLTYFLLQLSEFIINNEVCPQLGFMLAKYSKLNLNFAVDELEQKQYRSAQIEKYLDLVKEEQVSIAIGLAMIKQCFNAEEMEINFKRQLSQQSVISDKYLKVKILQLGKRMVEVCEQQIAEKQSYQQVTENMFKTYLVLKKIEEGSYQKYWERVYMKQVAFLSNQTQIKKQLTLGYHYLKNKVIQIIKDK